MAERVWLTQFCQRCARAVRIQMQLLLTTKTAEPWGASPLGLHLFLGPDASLMRKNVVRNSEEQRIVLVQCVLKKA